MAETVVPLPAPAPSSSSWLHRVKSFVAPITSSAAPLSDKSESEDTLAQGAGTAIGATTDACAGAAAAAGTGAPVTDGGTGAKDVSEKGWSAVGNLWKKARELGAEVIRLDPPEHNTVDVLPSSATAPALPGTAAVPVGLGVVSAPSNRPEAGAGAVVGVGDEEEGEEGSEGTGLLSGVSGRLKAFAGGGQKVKGFFTQGVASVKALVPARLTGEPAPPPVPEETFWGLSRVQRMQAFVLLLVAGCGLMGLALFVFLPLLLFAPSKFALAFTFGSVCFMGAFAAFRGPSSFARGLIEPERRLFTAGYVVSVVLTLYAALIAQSYVLVILAAGSQVVALLWYASSYFPYGQAGMKMLSKFCTNVCQKGCWPCLKACGRLCSS